MSRSLGREFLALEMDGLRAIGRCHDGGAHPLKLQEQIQPENLAVDNHAVVPAVGVEDDRKRARLGAHRNQLTQCATLELVRSGSAPPSIPRRPVLRKRSRSEPRMVPNR